MESSSGFFVLGGQVNSNLVMTVSFVSLESRIYFELYDII